MKVAVTATGKDLDSDLDPRFGRARYFIIVDTDTMAYDVKENIQNMDLPQGAGVQAGKTVANAGAEALITGNCGPKAYHVLDAAGIKVITGISGTVRDAVSRMSAGELVSTGGPNVEGHWQ